MMNTMHNALVAVYILFWEPNNIFKNTKSKTINPK